MRTLPLVLASAPLNESQKVGLALLVTALLIMAIVVYGTSDKDK